MGRRLAQFAETSRFGGLSFVLFMVMERFKHGDAGPFGERFRREGRMLPEGVTYHASWGIQLVRAVSKSWKRSIRNR
jgi:hypothetical protein